MFAFSPHSASSRLARGCYCSLAFLHAHREGFSPNARGGAPAALPSTPPDMPICPQSWRLRGYVSISGLFPAPECTRKAKEKTDGHGPSQLYCIQRFD